jgi:hypothetical protein
MATQPKRARNIDKHVHPQQVREMDVRAEDVTIEGLTDEECRRVARFFEYQFARLMVKMGMSGKYRFVLEAVKK